MDRDSLAAKIRFGIFCVLLMNNLSAMPGLSLLL